MREISLRVDRHLVNTGITPNQLTYLMIVAGVLAGAGLLMPGLPGAVLAVRAVPALSAARLRRRRGRPLAEADLASTGVYLDRVGHYLCDAALLVGFGAARRRRAGTAGGSTGCGPSSARRRARRDPDQGRDRPGRRGPHQGGLPPVKDEASEPRSSGLALARKAAAALKFHRLVAGVEASLLILVAGGPGHVRGDLFFTRLGVAVLAGIAVLQTLLHLVSILASSRLK